MKKTKLILLGCGGHAKSVIDSIEAADQYEIAGFVDRERDVSAYRGYHVIGCDNDLEQIYHDGVTHAFICVGFMGRSHLRQKLYQKLHSIGYTLPVIRDPSAIVAADAVIGEGTFVGKRAVVNSNAMIGKNVILNTGTLVEHECRVGDYVHLAVSSTLCGNVRVGENCFIGAGSVIVQGITLGEEGIIGAGSTIRKNTAPGTLTFTEKPVREIPV